MHDISNELCLLELFLNFSQPKGIFITYFILLEGEQD